MRYYNHKGEQVDVNRYQKAEDEGLLPSVTSIIDFYKNVPEIQASYAKEGTDFHQFVAEIDLGKTEHQSFSKEFCKTVVSEYRTLMLDLADQGWRNSRNEMWVYHDGLGYAGTIDKIMTRGADVLVIDWKLRTVNKDKPEYGKSLPMQIAAYGHAAYGHATYNPFYNRHGLSVLVDRKSGVFYPRAWTTLELKEAYMAFVAAHNLFCYTKGFNPIRACENFIQLKNQYDEPPTSDASDATRTSLGDD